MSLLESLAARGEETLEEHGEEWLLKGVAQAREAAKDEVLGSFGRDFALEALDVVEAHAPALARLGRGKAVAFLHLVGLGRVHEARVLWLMHRADFLERRAASWASTQEVIEASQRMKQDMADVLEALEAVGLAALRLALPLLVGAL